MAWVNGLILTSLILPLQPADEKQEASGVPVAETGKNEQFQGGFWPSPRLQKLFLRRIADDVCYRLEFEEDQRAEVEEAFVGRWTKFFDENRGSLGPLFNEYMELKMHIEPPEKEEIQDWAQRALPMFQSIMDEMRGGIEDFSEIATPEQRPKIKAQAMMMSGAMAIAETQIRKWQAGNFDPAEFIEPTPSQRRERRRNRESEAEASARETAEDAARQQQSGDFIDAELSLWEKYVVSTADRFNLDDAQRGSAISILKEFQSRADAYRSAHARELAELEKRLAAIEGGENDANPEATEKSIQQLYGPIDELFEELKSRIENIPSEAQRANANSEEATEPSAEEEKSINTPTEANPQVEKSRDRPREQNPEVDPPR